MGEALRTYITTCIHKGRKKNSILVEAIRDDLVKAMLDYNKLSTVTEHGKEEVIPSGGASMFARGLIREKRKYKELAESQAIEIAILQEKVSKLVQQTTKKGRPLKNNNG